MCTCVCVNLKLIWVRGELQAKNKEAYVLNIAFHITNVKSNGYILL